MSDVIIIILSTYGIWSVYETIVAYIALQDEYGNSFKVFYSALFFGFLGWVLVFQNNK